MSELRCVLEPANIEWRADGHPYNADFGDIYFSGTDGLAESAYVFLRHNQLESRWQHALPTFCIAETGFGSGLNFLLTRQLWEQHQPASSRLHYISVEKHPLRRADLQRVLTLFPDLHCYADELTEQYPALVTGHHELHFREHSITLHLLFGDGQAMLRQLLVTDLDNELQAPRAAVNAWYLDGFAPRVNPQLWSAELCAIVSQLSADGTTLSTYSAASTVKNNLQVAGFAIKKSAGFGSKRDMLTAVWQRYPPLSERSRQTSMHDFPKAFWYVNSDQNELRDAIVVGGGIVGCCSALSLARRGVAVTLVEQEEQLAAGASGNAQVGLYARLSPFASPLNDFALSAWLYALNYYRNYFSNCGQQCGLLQLLATEKEKIAYTRLIQQLGDARVMHYCNANEASVVAGLRIDKDAIFYSGAGWLQPKALCSALVDHPNITVKYDTAVGALEQYTGGWQIRDADDRPVAEASHVIIAMGRHSRAFPATEYLPLKSIRGQVSYVPANGTTEDLNCVVCERSFVMPAHQGQHTAGASYNLDATTAEMSAQDHHNNAEQLRFLLPDSISPAPAEVRGRVGFRCTTPDYLPMVGAVPDRTAFLRDYALLAHDAKMTIKNISRHLPGLYIATGFGSRAFCYAPLCAELLASQMCGEPTSLPAYISRALLPARFLVKDIIHGR